MAGSFRSLFLPTELSSKSTFRLRSGLFMRFFFFFGDVVRMCACVRLRVCFAQQCLLL